MAATYRLLSNNPGLIGDDVEATFVVRPEDYLSASGEMLAFNIVMSWTISAIWNPELLEENPLKTVFGYNNVCVGWDQPPALYPAAFVMNFSIFFSVRYCLLALARTALVSTSSACELCLMRIAAILYAFSIMGVSMIFVVTPFGSDQKLVIHVLAFAQLVFFRYIVVAVHFIYPDEPVPTASWVYLATYTISVFGLLYVGLSNLYTRSRVLEEGLEPMWSPTIGQAFDYSWFILNTMNSRFMPNAASLRKCTRVVGFKYHAYIAAEDQVDQGLALAQAALYHTKVDDEERKMLANVPPQQASGHKVAKDQKEPWPGAAYQRSVFLKKLQSLPPGRTTDDHDTGVVGYGDSMGIVGARVEISSSAIQMLPAKLRTGLLQQAGVFPACVRISHAPSSREWLRLCFSVQTPQGVGNFHFSETMKTFTIGNKSHFAAFAMINTIGKGAAILWQPVATISMALSQKKMVAACDETRATTGVVGKSWYTLSPFLAGNASQPIGQASSGPHSWPAATAVKWRLRPLQARGFPNKPFPTGTDGVPDDLRAAYRAQFIHDVEAREQRWEIMAQFASDPILHPINNLQVQWDEVTAPWILVGELVVPRQRFLEKTGLGCVGAELGPPWFDAKDLFFPHENELHPPCGDVSAFRRYLYPTYEATRRSHLLGDTAPAFACPFGKIAEMIESASLPTKTE